MIVLAFLFQMTAFMPSADTLTTADSIRFVQSKNNIEFLYQLFIEQAENHDIEEASEENTAESDYEELLEAYHDYQENPININSDDIIYLEEMGLLNVFQVEALQQYRRQFGDLLFIDELLMLDAFNEMCVAVITPLVYFGKNEKAQEREQLTPQKMLNYGKHQVTLNYAQKFDESTYYDDVPDSLMLAKKNAYYLGNPMKLQLKYAFRYKQRFRIGFALEKDAGEPLFFGRLSDTVQSIVSQHRKQGFDFYGMHLYATDLKIMNLRRGTTGNELMVKDLALGDYQLSFGQGLTLWSGMSFGKASAGSSVMKRAAGVRPKTSSSEGKFFRGAAVTIKYRDYYATAFYSLRKIDATIALTDTLDEPEVVSALQGSGYHRTLGELEKRNAIRQQAFGGHLYYAGPHFEVGFTAYHLKLSAPLELKPSKYNQYYFQGDHLTNMGLDFRWLLNDFVFFGELARSDNGAMAGLIGLTAKPKGYINFTVLYRNYDKRYQNLFNGAFGESSRGQGEEGVYLGLQCAPAPSWDLLAYCDFFRLTWLTSQVYNPSWGQDYSLKVSHQINRSASMQLQFRSKTKMKNSVNDHVYCHYPIFYTKRTVKFQISYSITDALSFSDKASYSHYLNDDGMESKGFLLCHDVAYKPPNRPFALTFRYTIFDSDDYNSRVSIYENDVIGAFSIPTLSGSGTRIYLLGNIKLFNSLSLYSRIGFSFFPEETKTDLKIELLWKG